MEQLQILALVKEFQLWSRSFIFGSTLSFYVDAEHAYIWTVTAVFQHFLGCHWLEHQWSFVVPENANQFPFQCFLSYKDDTLKFREKFYLATDVPARFIISCGNFFRATALTSIGFDVKKNKFK